MLQNMNWTLNWTGLVKHGLVKRVLKGGSYSHFPAQIFTKFHCPTAQILLSQCLPCSNLSPIPIFPAKKMGKSQFPFYPFRSLCKRWTCKMSTSSKRSTHYPNDTTIFDISSKGPSSGIHYTGHVLKLVKDGQ